MNNLLETVWHENPVILGAIAGIPEVKVIANGKEYFIHGIYKHVGEDKTEDKIRIFAMACDYSEKTFLDVEECTLITRSIDSLTLEESCKIPSIQEEAETELRLVSLTDRIMWLNINIKLNRLSALDFIYLLSIGIWTGSKEGVEVVE